MLLDLRISKGRAKPLWSLRGKITWFDTMKWVFFHALETKCKYLLVRVT